MLPMVNDLFGNTPGRVTGCGVLRTQRFNKG